MSPERVVRFDRAGAMGYASGLKYYTMNSTVVLNDDWR
jgi:hypothetical protein